MSETPYPALRTFIETAFAKRRRRATWLESTTAGLDAAGDVVDYPGAGADLRALLASGATDPELEHILFQTLGCGYDPRKHGESVRSWLKHLVRFVDQEVERGAWLAGFDEPSEVRAARLRPLVAAEVERIGAYELAERTQQEPPAIHAFLAGGVPRKEALDAFDHYQFGPWPDLRYLVACYFHEDYDVDSAPGDWEAVVDHYILAQTAGQVRGTVTDLGRLL